MREFESALKSRHEDALVLLSLSFLSVISRDLVFGSDASSSLCAADNTVRDAFFSIHLSERPHTMLSGSYVAKESSEPNGRMNDELGQSNKVSPR